MEISRGEAWRLRGRLIHPPLEKLWVYLDTGILTIPSDTRPIWDVMPQKHQTAIFEDL